MRLKLLLFFICSGILFVNAQKTQTYKGSVIDSTTKEAIPFATVAIYQNNILVDGTTTNEFGMFKINLQEVITHFEISFIGYKSKTIKRSEITDIGQVTFMLTPSVSKLEEVVVQVEQTTTKLKIDRKIINLGADLQQAGATTLEAFDQITEIQTDLGTRSLSLRGSGNVRLLINGKPSSMNPTELLEQLPASSVQRVEIITSPSAKNQADGLSGIINVVLKKNSTKGLNTNLNTGIGTKRYSYGIDGNFNFSWINFRWNLSQSGRGMDSKQHISQLYENGNTRDFFTPHDFYGLSRKLDTGLDFFINEKNELSIGLDYTKDFHRFFNTTFYSNVTNRDDFKYTRNSSHEHETTNFNLNYRVKFDKENHFLELDYQFSKNDNLLPAIDFEEEIFLFNEERRNDNILNAVALDYSLPITDNILFEAGGSWNERNLKSSLFLNPAQEEESLQIFKYDESLFGIYGLTNISLGKLTWQLGLRYENLTSNSINLSNNQTTDLKFSNVFPSLHVSYAIDDANKLNLGYSRRVSRPNFRNINPFQARNQYFEWVANPGLRPEFSNNLETNYQYKGNKLGLSGALFYRYRTDVIELLQDVDEEGVLRNVFDNIGEKHSYGIEANISYKLSDFWNSQLSTNYYHTAIDQDIFLTWDELYSANLIFKNTFKINKILSADISYRQNFKTQNTFDFIDPRNRVDVAVRIKLLENRLAMNLRVVDLLDNNLFYRTTITQNVTQNELWRFQSQTFGFLLSTSYKLFQNKGKTRNRKNRNYQYGGTTD
ncbi:outer membrane receptor protein involved in Fe transport [Aquimarina sp. MAR_2010_214]|uniref:TonB-dependent receptor n=1 Tax=Aquimarina sp. MAR_2010_214 TaxID=1250026 RepID=UPI000C70EA10|nr:outer membrane beta-barrel family protein [Aquimarina sp. MAR_2010_214]PKV51910.1 outer membrane receptor protein involved in Fe transport [Aquimarina sp. MAR_2010_214]